MNIHKPTFILFLFITLNIPIFAENISENEFTGIPIALLEKINFNQRSLRTLSITIKTEKESKNGALKPFSETQFDWDVIKEKSRTWGRVKRDDEKTPTESLAFNEAQRWFNFRVTGKAMDNVIVEIKAIKKRYLPPFPLDSLYDGNGRNIITLNKWKWRIEENKIIGTRMLPTDIENATVTERVELSKDDGRFLSLSNVFFNEKYNIYMQKDIIVENGKYYNINGFLFPVCIITRSSGISSGPPKNFVVSRYTFSNIKINEPIEESLLTPIIPIGASVVDEIQNKEYRMTNATPTTQHSNLENAFDTLFSGDAKKPQNKNNNASQKK